MKQLALNLNPECDERQRAYNALNHAAAQIGERAGNDPACYTLVGRGNARRQQFNPPQALRDLIAAMDDVQRGRITTEQAMGLLHTHDVELARFGKR